MLQTISFGYFARSAGADSPRRSTAPGARFCTNTSARCSSFSRIPAAAGCLTSSVSDSFDRFSHTKCAERPLTLASYARAKSPPSRRSTLMTRAPRSASCRVANGAATACSSVTTVIPSSGSLASTYERPEYLAASARVRRARSTTGSSTIWLSILVTPTPAARAAS